jgi:hypothetical protein
LPMKRLMSSSWPFNDPPNVAVFANRKVIFDRAWISYVTHDLDDGSWQFHCDQTEEITEDDIAIVSLKNILDKDQSIADLADLPLGWRAWRPAKDAPWQRLESDQDE